MTKIGVTLPQFTNDPDRFMSGVRRAEALGFDSIWVFDHLWPLGGDRHRPILECWTALAHVAAATDNVEIGTLVTRSSLRHPALLAKMAATVSAIAPGRLIVALGSGDHLNEQENRAFGLPFFGGPERVSQLVSVASVVGGFQAGERLTLHDDHADIDALPASPRVAPPAKVWIGGRSSEVLEAAGRLAGGWNGWGADLDRFAADAREVIALAGERPFDVSWAGQVMLAGTDAEATTRLEGRDPSAFVTGGPGTVTDALGRVVEAGASHLIVALPDAGEPGAYERLAEVAAALRAA